MGRILASSPQLRETLGSCQLEGALLADFATSEDISKVCFHTAQELDNENEFVPIFASCHRKADRSEHCEETFDLSLWPYAKSDGELHVFVKVMGKVHESAHASSSRSSSMSSAVCNSAEMDECKEESVYSTEASEHTRQVSIPPSEVPKSIKAADNGAICPSSEAAEQCQERFDGIFRGTALQICALALLVLKENRHDSCPMDSSGSCCRLGCCRWHVAWIAAKRSLEVLEQVHPSSLSTLQQCQRCLALNDNSKAICDLCDAPCVNSILDLCKDSDILDDLDMPTASERSYRPCMPFARHQVMTL